MRPPAEAVVDNLVWSTAGTVWAFYDVRPLPYAHRSDEAKIGVHATLRTMLLGLPQQSVLMGLHEQLDPAEIVDRTIEGVPMTPAVADMADATLEELDRHLLLRRSYLLGFRLPDDGRGWVRPVMRSAAGSAAAVFGSAPFRPTRAEIAARRRQAELVVSGLGPIGDGLTACTAGRIRWLYARSARRGLLEPVFNSGWEPETRVVGDGEDALVDSGPLTALFGGATFTENGDREDPDRPRRPRYLRVDTDHGSSFQAFFAMADMPSKFVFPGGAGEWWQALESVPWPVEWVLRLNQVPNEAAKRKAHKHQRSLLNQVDEYDGEVTGAPDSLANAIAGIKDLHAELAANPSEREGQGTILFALSSDSLADLEERARALQAMYEPMDYALGRPAGQQADLYQAFLPGAETPAVCRDYLQYALSDTWAAGLPYTGTTVGDESGMWQGSLADSAIETPVLLDPSLGPRINKSGSMGFVGVLGTGKSYAAKRVLVEIVTRGGQVSCVDRTASGEYVALAEVMSGRSQVIRLGGDSTVCLDPLRIFKSTADRQTFTLGMLSLLCGVVTQSAQGDALSEAVELVAGRPEPTVMDVVAELERMGETDEPAREVARRLRSFSRRGAARAIFDPHGERMSLDADYLVFHAPSMVLPKREQLENEHLARQMLPEQIINLAVLYGIAAIQRTLCFASKKRFTAANFDEAHYLTVSPHGLELLIELVRDGRKHNAAALIQSQSAADFPPELTKLLGPRFVFRQFPEPDALDEAQRFIGLKPDEGVADLLSSEDLMPTGTSMMRDVRGRVALVRWARDPQSRIDAALNTNPDADEPDEAAVLVDERADGVAGVDLVSSP